MARKTFIEETVEAALAGFDVVTGNSKAQYLVGLTYGASGWEGRLMSGSALQRVSPPDTAFDILPFSVYRTPAGYVSDFDWENPYKDLGTTYFVDAVTGSDSNDGITAATPLQGLKTAFQKPDCVNIYVRAGVHDRQSGSSNNWFLDLPWPTARPLALIGWGGKVDIYVANRASSYTWVDAGSGAWYTTGLTPTQVHNVVDSNATDPTFPELPRQFTLQADVATLKAASEGLYFDTSNGRIYLKKTGGSSPASDANIKLLRKSAASSPATKQLYMRNVRWFGRDLGWNPGILTVDYDASVDTRAVAVDCTFAFAASTNNAVSVLNYDFMGFLRCKAAYGGLDIFNAHNTAWQTSGTKIPVYLEENCSGFMSGWRGSVGSNQTTTLHDGIRGVRINHTSVTAGGPCVQDKGTSSSSVTYSWNLGGSFTNNTNDASWGFNAIVDSDSRMYFDQPTFAGSSTGVLKATATNGIAYVRGDANLSTASFTAGNVRPY